MANARYKATPPTLVDGDLGEALLDVNGRQVVTGAGDVASGSADSGNPVKVGGKYNSTNPTLVDGQRGDLQLGSRGSARVELWGANASTAINSRADNADAQATQASTGNLAVAARETQFNGTTWDRVYGNVDTAALITATGATTTQTGADQINYNSRGVKVVLDMTTVGTGSVTLTIQGKDIASGKYYTLLAGAAVTTISTNVYEVGPGAPATANVSANSQLPRTWRVLVTANNANATTYTVGASVIR